MFENKGNTMIIVVVAVIIFVGIVALVMTKPSSDENDMLASTDSGMSEIEKEVINTLTRIGNINIDTSVLDNPAFNMLDDKSRPIVEEPVSRANPFAEIDINEVNTALTNSSDVQLGGEGNGTSVGDAGAGASNAGNLNLSPRDVE